MGTYFNIIPNEIFEIIISKVDLLSLYKINYIHNINTNKYLNWHIIINHRFKYFAKYSKLDPSITYSYYLYAELLKYEQFDNLYKLKLIDIIKYGKYKYDLYDKEDHDYNNYIPFSMIIGKILDLYNNKNVMIYIEETLEQEHRFVNMKINNDILKTIFLMLRFIMYYYYPKFYNKLNKLLIFINIPDSILSIWNFILFVIVNPDRYLNDKDFSIYAENYILNDVIFNNYIILTDIIFGYEYDGYVIFLITILLDDNFNKEVNDIDDILPIFDTFYLEHRNDVILFDILLDKYPIEVSNYINIFID